MAGGGAPVEVRRHEGFLRHANFRWAKIGGATAAVALLIYLFDNPQPRPAGDTAYGYTLGTIGALLILWLTALGLRKRMMTPGHWSLKAWTSAHVYLGLTLLVLATLHTGFQFGWNVHTLAYTLMVLVIASGIFGVIAYAVLPTALSQNRAELTERQMLENMRALDRQLQAATLPLGEREAGLVAAALAEDPFAGGLWRRLSARDHAGPTQAARDGLDHETDPAHEKVANLLDRKLMILRQTRRHLRLKALLAIWLTVHVPLTIALLAALTAHIVAVFFYW